MDLRNDDGGIPKFALVGGKYRHEVQDIRRIRPDAGRALGGRQQGRRGMEQTSPVEGHAADSSRLAGWGKLSGLPLKHKAEVARILSGARQAEGSRGERKPCQSTRTLWRPIHYRFGFW